MKEAILVIFLVVFSLLGILAFAQTPPPPPESPDLEVVPPPPSNPDELDGELPPAPCAPGEVCTTSSSSTSSSGSSGGGSSSSSGGSSGGSSSGGSSGSVIIPAANSNNATNTTNATISTTSAQSTAQQVSQSAAQKTSQPAASKPSVEEAQSASSLSFYITTGIFAVLFVVALVFAVLKLRKPKVPVQSYGVQSRQINPQIVQLRNYVSENLSKGYTREQIAAVLIQSGYSQQTINEAMRLAP